MGRKSRRTGNDLDDLDFPTEKLRLKTPPATPPQTDDVDLSDTHLPPPQCSAPILNLPYEIYSKIFDYADPTSIYSLHLTHPHLRSTASNWVQSLVLSQSLPYPFNLIDNDTLHNFNGLRDMLETCLNNAEVVGLEWEPTYEARRTEDWEGYDSDRPVDEQQLEFDTLRRKSSKPMESRRHRLWRWDRDRRRLEWLRYAGFVWGVGYGTPFTKHGKVKMSALAKARTEAATSAVRPEHYNNNRPNTAWDTDDYLRVLLSFASDTKHDVKAIVFPTSEIAGNGKEEGRLRVLLERGAEKLDLKAVVVEERVEGGGVRRSLLVKKKGKGQSGRKAERVAAQKGGF
ncbi:hypothetical protein SAICODRAFT_22579 [Saitoella complicata NRRL Y-17804]|nr:uncharacterized protein SAICODRAFT_22579 [Saitoella complicata NRRL Y-17804]ODQ56171.1 hypothetical protein SAICODRAFT_22579 [Saitoella complicata NRRL Y-17804]